jgi:transposase
MGKHRLAFIAFDSAKEKHAVAIADDGRDGEVRYVGEMNACIFAMRLDRPGMGCRQLTDLGHVCDVVAPTMIPKRSGDRSRPTAGIP